MISLGVLAPHPPIMVAGIGKPADLKQIDATIAAMGAVNQELAKAAPDTLVVFTPHGTVFGDALVIYGSPVLSGNLSRFGLDRSWRWENDLELARAIESLGQTEGLPVYLLDPKDLQRYEAARDGLDHGVLVPLSFFEGKWAEHLKLVVIPLSFLPLLDLYRFGMIIRKAADGLKRRVAIIASGDLSHCLQPGAPAGFDPRGGEFDEQLLDLVRRGDAPGFFRIDPVLQEKAAECGFRSVIMLLGVLDQVGFTTQVHSYQGPFGVGYGVASFRPEGFRESYWETLQEKHDQAVADRRAAESPLVRYARRVVEAHVRNQPLPAADELGDFQRDKAGTFVSIKKHGQLRGCIGTTEATQANVAQEVRQNAISAATRDPRFDPVTPPELPDLVYSVDVLKPAEPIRGVEELEPQRYGVIVSKGFRKGLLLPNLEGIETAAEQVRIAKQKAGIGAEETVQLERFEVVRYS